MKINRHIIKKLIEPVINKDIKNHAHITSALMNWLTDSNLETMLEMIHNDGFTTHNIGDIVKFTPETWWFKDEMMWDLKKIRIGDLLEIKVVDNYLFYSINENDFIQLWYINDHECNIYIYMNESKIKVY